MKRFLGTVTEDEVLRALREGRPHLDGYVSTERVRTVTADTSVADLFADCAESQHPVAVLDERDRLIGVIPRITLLSALAAATPDEPTQGQDQVELVGTKGEPA
jgi:glycine betaine/proline transport system ATP-binding protein